jgi:hypothetical protein
MQKLLPIMWAAFWVNAATGTILLIADATTKLRNPDFFVKMGFILLAVITQRLIEKRVFRDPHVDKAALTTNARLLAVASLVCWLGAITAGRLLAYVGPVAGL